MPNTSVWLPVPVLGLFGYLCLGLYLGLLEFPVSVPGSVPGSVEEGLENARISEIEAQSFSVLPFTVTRMYFAVKLES